MGKRFCCGEVNLMRKEVHAVRALRRRRIKRAFSYLLPFFWRGWPDNNRLVEISLAFSSRDLENAFHARALRGSNEL